MKEHVLDDQDLMAEVRGGKREALEVLMRRHATPLLTFLERMSGDRHRGEELFQEVFLAVWTKRGTYAHPRRFKAWLYAIALNKCRTMLRRPRLATQVWQETLSVSRESSPVELAIVTETATLVAAAVDLLPERQREVMILRIWQQLRYSEIASILDSSESSVRSNMHHGLCTLREKLGPRLTV